MSRPADACPYQRPFPPDFDACATFTGQVWLPLDSHFDALKPQQTCRHLTVGRLAGSFYPRCALGDASARERLVVGTASSG
jgi:hypothetical protein